MKAADTIASELSAPLWVLEHASDETNLYAATLADTGRDLIGADAHTIIVDRGADTIPGDLIAVIFKSGEPCLYWQALAMPNKGYLGKEPGPDSNVEMLVSVRNNEDLSRMMFLMAEKISEIHKVIAYQNTDGDFHLIKQLDVRTEISNAAQNTRF